MPPIVALPVFRRVPLLVDVLVDDPERDEAPVDLVVTLLGDVGHPPRRDPGPRAHGVEEEIEVGGHPSTLTAFPLGMRQRQEASGSAQSPSLMYRSHSASVSARVSFDWAIETSSSGSSAHTRARPESSRESSLVPDGSTPTVNTACSASRSSCSSPVRESQSRTVPS